jgi:Right handed beta helix region
MLRFAFLAVAVVALASCDGFNPNSCELPENFSKPECSIGGPCTSNASCTSTPNTSVCDLTDNGGTCVQCTATDHAACTGTTPRCEDRRCAACVDDTDCGVKGVCLPSGACADQSNVIHVRVDGTSNFGCGAIGNECNLPRALGEADGPRNVIRLDEASTYNTTEGFNLTKDVTIDARGSTLHRTMNDGSTVTITGSSKILTILGGTIDGGHSGGGLRGNGIQCSNGATVVVNGSLITNNDESGIEASSCTVVVTDARIQGNSKKSGSTLYTGININAGSLTISRSRITSNAGGGILVTSGTSFVIVGNALLNNGTSGSSVTGGLNISSMEDSKNRLEFNTIAANKSRSSDPSGVKCSAGTFTAKNNIIWNNMGGIAQIGDTCMHAYSDIGPVGVSGNNNTMADPKLANEANDHHLMPGSPVLRMADPNANLNEPATRDIDGDVRMSPADIGADQTR